MKYILSIFFLLTIGNHLLAQNFEVKLQSDKSVVAINEPIKVVLISNVKGRVIEKWPTNFIPEGAVKTSSKFVQDANSSGLVQEHLFTYSGTFNRGGNYTIGPLEIKYEGKTIKSNSVNIQVKQNGATTTNAKHAGEIAQVIVQTNKSEIYEGESIIIDGYLKTNSPNGKINITQSLEILGSPDIFNLTAKQQWQKSNPNDKYAFNYHLRKVLIYPLSLDKITFTPYKINYVSALGLTDITSNIPSIRIKPLPYNAPKSFYGAVGHFQIHQYTSNTLIRQGDVIPVEVTVSGTGNFHQLQAPTLTLPAGMLMYGEPTVREFYSHTNEGTTGKVMYKYHVQILTAGEQSLPSIKYTYFDLSTEKYITTSDSNIIHLNVLTNEEYQSDFNRKKRYFEDNEIAPFTTIEKSKTRRYIISEIWFWSIIMLMPIVPFIIMLYSRSDNKFIDERFTKFRRRPNRIKETFKLLKVEKGQLSAKEFKLLIALIEKMVLKRLNYSPINNESVYDLITRLENLEGENDTAKALKRILTISYKGQYAFIDENETNGIVEELKLIAKSWKQI